MSEIYICNGIFFGLLPGLGAIKNCLLEGETYYGYLQNCIIR